jgi:hypothetical protein
MGVAVIVVFLLLIGPVAVRYGADSRVSDPRGWWPGAPRARR